MSKYVNTQDHKDLSRTAHALVLPLILLSNKNNEVDKKAFTKFVGWITDYRTWDKYWTELVDKGVLIQINKDVWMVSPHAFYADGVSHSTLINKWNEVRNAVK